MVHYVCVLEVEAVEDGSAFGQSFCAGDFRMISLVVEACCFEHACHKVKLMCIPLDFCNCSVFSLTRACYD